MSGSFGGALKSPAASDTLRRAVMNNVPSDFRFNFNGDEQERQKRIKVVWDAFWNAGYWVDRLEDRETLLSIATEFNIGGDSYDYSDLVSLWVRFPNGCTERRIDPANPRQPAKYTISQSSHKLGEFRAFLREAQREHKERLAQGDRYMSRIKPYQYIAGGVNRDNKTPGRHFEGVYREHGQADATSVDYSKLIQGRAAVDKLFDLVEHAEKAEAGRDRADLARERILEELRGLRIDIQALRQPERERKDYTLPLGSACLGVLVLMLFFK